MVHPGWPRAPGSVARFPNSAQGECLGPLGSRAASACSCAARTRPAPSTIRVLFNTYSVPSRLKGERVEVRVHERYVEVRYAGELQMVTERLRGRNGHRINYRHLIWSLVRKPGAFARYRYRDELFPSLPFRRAYDAIVEQQPDVRGDLEYLRILHLAAATLEADVEAALERLLAAGTVPNADAVRELVTPDLSAELPELAEYPVDLNVYDGLLPGNEVAL